MSQWALEHRSFVWFLMAVAVVAGALAYPNLGRQEDPAFAIKTMIVTARWPGASIGDTINQVTDRIEKEVQQLGALDYTKSYTTPGQATVFVQLRDTTKPADLPQIFYQVRKKIGDIRSTFPVGMQDPVFDDEFGDVYGNIYAFTSDGLTFRQLRDAAEQVRSAVLKVPSIGKTEILGDRAEVVYLDFSTRKLAGFGIDRQAVIRTLQEQNAITATGVVQAGRERVSLRVGGQLTSEESLRVINLRINDRFFRLTDVADISRGYEDPPVGLFRFNGQPAIGLAITMQTSGNLLTFGKALKAGVQKAESELPVGIDLHLVSNQPKIVEEAVGGFTTALLEAIAIVLAISFVSLGWRAGLVVSICIPIVLAVVFVVMVVMEISLQRISLGALIIALGLLVDDAMITVEMMVAHLEKGETREKAAIFAYTSTAFPMLTGTLVTVASFMPVGLNSSSAGEYTYTLFVVITAALLISWVVAVLFAPLLGVKLLPKTMKRKSEEPGRLMKIFSTVLVGAMRGRWITVGLTVALLGLSVYGLQLVQQQFFPSADRPELLVDMTLPQSSNIAETQARMDRFEATLKGDPDIVLWSSYVGLGAIRFYLPLDQQLSNAFFGQIVVQTKDLEARDRVQAKLTELGRDSFVGTDIFVHPLDLGPPAGRPVQYRLSGPDVQAVRQQAIALASVVAADPRVKTPTFDWNEPGKVLRIDVMQDKARQLGVTSEAIATLLNGLVGGSSITQINDAIYLVPVIGRAPESERNSLDTFRELQVLLPNGSVVPLLTFATLRYEMEQPIVWRRDRQATITVRSSIAGETQPATIVAELAPAIAEFAAKLPPGYSVALGGSVEESGKGMGPILTIVPFMLLAIAFLLMVQLHSIQKTFIVASVAPLGLIGVVAALLLSGKPMGFVAILGSLALIGIIIRNTVILVTQIEVFEKDGLDRWKAVIEATLHRTRPILLTSAAASLGMIPIAIEVFWGPMAFAMIGGIIASTLLTLFFLPALYVGWYGIREAHEAAPKPDAEPTLVRVAAE